MPNRHGRISLTILAALILELLPSRRNFRVSSVEPAQRAVPNGPRPPAVSHSSNLAESLAW